MTLSYDQIPVKISIGSTECKIDTSLFAEAIPHLYMENKEGDLFTDTWHFKRIVGRVEKTLELTAREQIAASVCRGSIPLVATSKAHLFSASGGCVNKGADKVITPTP